MIYLLLFISSLVSLIVLTPYLIEFLHANDFVDIPNSRKVHDNIIPRMGGVLIHFAVTFEILCFYGDINTIRYLIMCSFVLVLCGVLDDGFGLKWKFKFIFQIISVLFIIYHFGARITSISVFEMELKFPANYIILFLFILGCINALNLMDGLDGLVSGFSFTIFMLNFAMGYILNNTFLMIYSITLAGALLGFLKYNAFPARIFLGDSGSLMIGFFLVVTSFEVSLAKYSGNLNITPVVFLLAIPIFDTLRVIIIRLASKKSPFLPDQNHLHHLILGNNINHKTTVFIIQSFSLLYIFAAIFYYQGSYLMAYFLFFTTTLIFLLFKQLLILFGNYNKIQTLLKSILHIPVRIIHLFDHYLLSLSVIAFICILITSANSWTSVRIDILSIFIVFEVSMMIIAYYQSRSYDKYNRIYIFLNFFLFFCFNEIKAFIGGAQIGNTLIQHSKIVNETGVIILVFIIVLFLISRKNVFSKDVMFFNGIDLYIMVITLFVFIVKNMFSNNMLNTISNSLFLSLILYTWIKIMMFYYKERSHFFFYVSFAVPISAMLIVMFFK